MSAHSRPVWPASAALRGALILAIGMYRVTLGWLLGGQCRFEPSCSTYAEEAIRVHGAAKGSALAIWRILRCSPLSRAGLDPVPGRVERAGTYDIVILRDGPS